MKDMKKTAALLAAMALLGVGSASAAEAAPMYALKGITVTATRQAESLKDVPANVQVITEKDIKLRNVRPLLMPLRWRLASLLRILSKAR